MIVSHDEGGNELHQMSVLRLPLPSGQPARLEDLEPLARDPRYMHGHRREAKRSAAAVATLGIGPGRGRGNLPS